MPAIHELQAETFRQLRLTITVQSCGFREGTKDIERGNGGRGRLEWRKFRQDFAAKLHEKLIFQCFSAFVGAEDLRLHFLELRGDESLCVGHGLLAMPRLRD